MVNTKYISGISVLFRMCLAGVFIYAAVEKIAAPAEFAITIENYRLIPSLFSNTIAIFLPWIELWCGIFLLFGIWQRGSAVLLAGMCLVFIAAILSAMIRGLEIDCGCFGLGEKISVYRILEDLLLLVMALFLIKFPSTRHTLHQIKKTRAEPVTQKPDA
jgi:uncharacterized membrane protein YphA (DoxX/SURF4 family)